MTLREKIISLIDRANRSTGLLDTNLTDSVLRLCNWRDNTKSVFVDITKGPDVDRISCKPVRFGTKVTCSGRVDFTSYVSGDRLLFTLPSEVRPFIKYLYKCGDGGRTYDDTGYVLPNGEVRVQLGASKQFLQYDFSWDVITPEYFPVVDESRITSYSGGIAIIDGVAIMQLSFTLKTLSTGWQLDLLSIPNSVLSSSLVYPLFPFCVYRSRTAAPYPDANIDQNGKFHIYVNASYGDTVDVFCIWDLKST